MPILSYGVRAYVDVPYLLLVLGALLVESRRRRAGAPVLALLALAGLLRPEAWAFSGLYWLYLMDSPRAQRSRTCAGACGLIPCREHLVCPHAPAGRTTIARGPDVARRRGTRRWVLSDLAITGDALWSLTNTRHTAHALDRITGIGNVPEYIPRRIGEILRPPVLAGAALGGAVAAVAAPPGAPGSGCGRARGAGVRRVRSRRAADQHALRLPRGRDPVRVLRRRRVRLDAP